MNKKNTNSLSSWNNLDNVDYYENIPIETFKKYATLGGIEDGCDIDIIFDYIKQADSILEIGAGYGRVLKNLLDRGYKGKLYGIERSRNLSKYLKYNFANLVHIINADITNFEPSKKFSIILWLWTGISDFSKLQHVSMLKRISGWLDTNGLLILDTISHEETLAKEFTFHDQIYVEKASHGTVYGFVPTCEEMADYAKQLGFKIKHLEYHTTTDRSRIIHLMQRITS